MMKKALIGSVSLSIVALAHLGEKPTNVPRHYNLINYGDGTLENAIKNFSDQSGSEAIILESATETPQPVVKNIGNSLKDAVLEFVNSNPQSEFQIEAAPNAIEYQNIRIYPENSIKNMSPAMKDALLAALSFLQESFKVVRTDEAIKVNPRYKKCYKAFVPESHHKVGVEDADFILYVTDQPDFCGSSTLGWAVSCFADQNDKPIAGQLNICTRNMDPSNDSAGAVGYAAAFFAHEIMHALGFASDTLPYFRDGDSLNLAPRSRRDQYGSPPVNSEGYFTPGPSTFEAVVLKPKTSRSPNPTFPSAVSAGYLVTPATQRAVRSHFGCSSLRGAAFEDEGGEGSQGSHLERRIFGPELMTGVMASRPRASPISLAVLEDSGWYVPSYFAVPEMVWGRDNFINREGLSGCEFASIHKNFFKSDGNPTETCPLRPKSHLSSSDTHLCNGKETLDSCLPDATGAGRCFFRDFGNGCRTRDIYHSTGYLNADSSCTRDVQGNQSAGDFHGLYSRCTDNTLYDGKSRTGSCYPMKCGLNAQATIATIDKPAISDMVLMYDRVEITVGKGSETPVSVVCFSDEVGQQKRVPGRIGTVTCPDVAKVCAGAPCLNGGFFKTNRCVCQPGYAGEFCEFEARSQFLKSIPPRVDYEAISGATLLVGGKYHAVPSAPLNEKFVQNLGVPLETLHDSRPIKYRAVSRLPTGLHIDPSTGVISGIPTEEAECQLFTIGASYSGDDAKGERRMIVQLGVSKEEKAPAKNFKDARLPCARVAPTVLEINNVNSIASISPPDRDLSAFTPIQNLHSVIGVPQNLFIIDGTVSGGDRSLNLKSRPVGITPVIPSMGTKVKAIYSESQSYSVNSELTTQASEIYEKDALSNNNIDEDDSAQKFSSDATTISTTAAILFVVGLGALRN